MRPSDKAVLEGVKEERRRAPGSPVPIVAQERRHFRRRRPPAVRLLQSIAVAATLIVAIVFTSSRIKPIYTDTSLVTSLIGRDTTVALMGPLARLLASSEYARDRQAFKRDLLRTGRISEGRADSVSAVAVREAYLNRISPAIIFGVMLTENARFISTAKSNVGAVGLMQVYPKVWLPVLSDSLGTDLSVDSTNLRYGARILSRYFYPKTASGRVARERPYDVALLRYNGCVRGSNTPNCHTYPGKVKNFVSRDAVSLCRGRSFEECIAKPFLAGLFGDTSLTRVEE